ncbi:uncharacterized protein LOC116262152 isoform X2 [Nymphaea colorata]|uniref:uncharacterized protein LOC116262152 isoform X2 n=1 Tax=Nymphaea colorata TaxID=210225 RepID=UPI00129EB7B4|nr:uncharacterized protein LOC116262152 isoform X2 [Nymphaea colorata]
MVLAGEGGKEVGGAADATGLRGKEGDAVLSPDGQRVKEGAAPPTPLVDTSREHIKKSLQEAARTLAAEPIHLSATKAWGVLEPISSKARDYFQGKNIMLVSDENIIGRGNERSIFRCDSPVVSGRHCKIFRSKVVDNVPNAKNSLVFAVYIRDTSTNGTYLNWEMLKKNDHVELHHGDVISLANRPDNENTFAFVYREVDKSVVAENSLESIPSKRKTGSANLGPNSKKPKGLGIGAPDGPISLDDVRILQRSNEDLRKQLETHVLTIETLHSEARAAAAHHETELKELKESISLSYADQVKHVHSLLEAKQKELDEVSVLSEERKSSIADLNERLAAAIQSRTDADGIINSQKTTISELESQLEEERNQRRVEREQAAVDLKSALERARSEAEEEIKRQNDAALRQQNELQEVISKLQESDKESRALVELLRSKLEDARESFVKSEKKVRQLEAKIHAEQIASADAQKKTENMEAEVIRLRHEVEKEKVAREEAWAKLSALELEMAAAIRDLSIEKQKFQGARERIILRETQLRAFYSTTEEISSLLAKQQAQIKAMQRTLEDEENCIDNHTNTREMLKNSREASCLKNVAGEASTASTRKNVRSLKNMASDGSSTEKHYCGHRSHECGEEEETQDEECTSRAHEKQGFGSDIDLADTLPDRNNQIGTEQVAGTEAQASPCGLGIPQNTSYKSDCVAGETMEVDEELEGRHQFVPLHVVSPSVKSLDAEANHEERESGGSGRHGHLEVPETMEEDTQAGSKDDVRMIGTADLLASEPLGSWAASTAPSCHGENESPCSAERITAAAANLASKEKTPQQDLCASQVATNDFLQNKEDVKPSTGLMEEDTEIQLPAAGSQNVPVRDNAVKMSQEQRQLSAMIDIIDPDFRKKFQDTERLDESRSSDEDTQDYSHSSSDGTDEGSGESA